MADKGKESQTELASAPFDGISSVRFSPTDPSHLLVSSWDTTVRFYDVNANEQRCKFDHRAAVLDCCFSQDGKHGFSGGLDTSVREFDLESETFRHLGQHDQSISSTVFSKTTNTLITGSWDRTLRFWDPRAQTSQQASYALPERVYNMDITGTTLVVAMASRLFHIYDIRHMDTPAQERESSLKFLTRALACMVDGQGYATGSVEGRIAVEYFDPSAEAQEKNYNTFASAGSDGTVSIWDHKSKKRLRQYSRYNSAVPSLSFSCDGARLAVGVSYNWDEGSEGARASMNTRPQIWIRDIGDEVKPKGWTP
ncbi:hypothetical protein EW145_g2146 [Phellinidium pouzarii]|uniref:Uncharacterized protein n=1 Tax=Phellinidium pouzarii TaxID=167371 RepID=A0A4S4LBX8_9AGAM|nr:hypothetical protein EW145_g2146 [Phellinidium pouzarii]